MKDSILIQFRIPQKYVEHVKNYTTKLSDELGYTITPSAFIKSQTVKWLAKQFPDEPQPPKKDFNDVLRNWGK